MAESEADELPTRADDLRELVARLQRHAIVSVENQEFEAAALLIGAAEALNQAKEKLEDAGTADDPFEGIAPLCAGG